MALPKFFRDDWPRKLAALVFALIIWYSVYRQIQEPQTFRDLPMTISTGSGLAITNRDQLPRITVTIRGSQRALNKLNNSDIRISQALPDDTVTGPYQIRLKPGNIDVPGGLQVTRIEPDSFTVNVDRQITVNLPVRQIFDGEPPAGSVIKNLTITPARVTVTGPESIVKDITEITTQPIMLDQNNPEYFSVAVQLATYPQIALDTNEVRVSVEYLRRNDNRFFSSLNMVVLNRSESDLYVAEFIDPPNPVIEANILGPKAILDSITAASLRPFIDISDRTTTGDIVLPVQMWVDAAECRVVSTRPTQFRVRLKRRTYDNSEPASTALPNSPVEPSPTTPGP